VKRTEFIVTAVIAVSTTVIAPIYEFPLEDTIIIVLLELFIGLAFMIGGSVYDGVDQYHASALGGMEDIEEAVKSYRREIDRSMGSFKQEILEYARIVDHVGKIDDVTVLKDLARISHSLAALQLNPILLAIARRELTEISYEFGRMSSLRAFSRRASIGNTEAGKVFRYLIDSLPENSTYCTVSTMEFWSEEVVGDPRAFLDRNIVAAKGRGVTVRRLFALFARPSSLSARDKRILRMHLEVAGGPDATIEERFVVLLEQGREFVRNFAVCRQGPKVGLAAEMHYVAEPGGGRRLDRIDLSRDLGEVRPYEERFESLFAKGEPLESLELDDA